MFLTVDPTCLFNTPAYTPTQYTRFAGQIRVCVARGMLLLARVLSACLRWKTTVYGVRAQTDFGL